MALVTIGRDRLRRQRGHDRIVLTDGQQARRAGQIKYRPEHVAHIPVWDGGFFVYFLRCPESGTVRYVGITSNPLERFYTHAYGGSRGTSDWVRSIRSRGMILRMDVIAHGMQEQSARYVESRLIRLLHSQLLNKQLSEPTPRGKKPKG